MQIKEFKFDTLDKPLVYLLSKNTIKGLELLGDIDSYISREKITVLPTLGKYPFSTITFMSANDIASLDNEEDVYVYVEEVEDIQQLVEDYYVSKYKPMVIGHEEAIMPQIILLDSKRDLEEEIQNGKNIAEGINYARYLADLPSNYMTPFTFMEEASMLAEQYDMELTILDKQMLMDMQAGGILSVNQGSDIPAYMICLDYHGGDGDYQAVVGKGLCFDSGGYNLKHAPMGMKYDMCGGADVLGIMKIIASMKSKKNIYGIIPTTENLINGSATKPGDVITTLSKKTIEVTNTDAEGRLILCDALTYAQQLDAKRIIDLATLTGACNHALGDVYTGIFTTSDTFYEDFKQGLDKCGEYGWRLPIHDKYFKKLKSSVADFKNSTCKPGGGAAIAASFLNEFIEDDVEYIHLDVAGTATIDHQQATGAMVKTVAYVLGDL